MIWVLYVLLYPEPKSRSAGLAADVPVDAPHPHFTLPSSLYQSGTLTGVVIGS